MAEITKDTTTTTTTTRETGRDHGDARQPFIPGKREIIAEIRGVNEQLRRIEEEMKRSSGRIHEIIKKEKENSPRSVALGKLGELKNEANGYREEKKTHLEEMDGLKKQIEEVRDVLGRDNLNSINSEEQLDQKMRELEMRLIRESLGVVEEKRIAGELNSLKTKKSKMGDLKESLRNLRRLETRMKECRAEVGLANKEIRERQGKMGELKEELDRLNESNRNKHPEIEALNSKIAQLKEQKKVQLELREERRGVVHAMEVEYKKHEQDLLVAKEQEEKKEQLRKEIGARRKQVAEIRLKMGQFGKEVFERLIVAVEQVRRSGNYFLSADLVGELVRHGIALPSNEATAKKTLEELKNGRDNADETFASKRGVLQNEIDVIEKEVAEMQKMLAEMPESNVELLKKYKGDRKQY